MVRLAVVMHQIQFEGSHKLLGRAALKSHIVVGADIVHQGVETAEAAKRLLNHLGSSLSRGNLSGNKRGVRAGSPQLCLEFLTRVGVAVQKNGNRSFRRGGANDRGANSF